VKPPRLARVLLGWVAPADLRASIVDDLDEVFARRVVAVGARRARWWYRRQVWVGSWALFALHIDRRDRRSDRPGSIHEGEGVDAMRRTSVVLNLWQDLREAWRAVRHRLTFAGVAIMSLALGIGATTAMFSVVNGVLLRPLDLPDPGQLMMVGEGIPQVPRDARFVSMANPAAFLAWRQQATDFSGLSAIQPSSFTLPDAGRPQLVRGARVSANFFDVLGVRAQLGRLLVPHDEQDVTQPMVITDRLWRSAFSADPGAIGRRIGTPGAEATVVGVLPRSFRMEGSELGPMLAGGPTDYFSALRFGPGGDTHLTAVFSNFNYHVIGRLRPGVTPAAALAQLNGIQANLARTAPEKLGLFADLTSVRDQAVAPARQELWLLFSGVLAVLLIVCVNLGGLWVTRIADRRRDWAIRAALGAAPSRLARQVLGESLVLALIGGVLGLACAAVSLDALLAVAPANLPRLDEVRLDWRVLGFGLLLSLLAGLVTGLVPALRLNRADPQDYLKATSAATTADRSSLRSRQALIGLQAALATVLLSAAGLLGLSFYRLVSQPKGFSTEHAFAADVMLGAYTYPQRDQLLRRLPAEVAALPGVTDAAFTSHLPLQGESWVDSITVPGRVVSPAEEPHVNVRFVSPGSFAALGIPMLAGRDLSESDRPTGPPPTSAAEAAAAPPGVLVLSRTAARLLWVDTPPRDLVGRALVLEGQTVHVIGIAADARATLAEAPPAVVYQPYWEEPPTRVSLVARSAMSATALASSIRAAVWRVAPLAPVPTLGPLSDLEATAVAPQRYELTLLVLFAVLALLLAAMGVYALVAHSVARRRKELALRMTLGAHAANLWRLVLRQALAPVASGVVVGLVAAVGAGQLLAAMLFQVTPFSPMVLGPVALAVLVAASVACVVPARRAIRSDPWTALRAD
jgi:predicted permease